MENLNKTEHVAMDLTLADLDNIEYMSKKFHSNCGAQAISRTLEIFRQIMEISEDNRLLVEMDDGKTKIIEIQKLF